MRVSGVGETRWAVYNVLFAVGYALMLPRFLLRMWKRGGYRKDFLQRFGRYAPETLRRLRDRRRFWIHAVSVGEIGVALRFMEELRRADPAAAFVLSATTSTGHRFAETKIGKEDVLIYFPADFPVVVKRALAILEPKALILVEGEIWPNLVRYAKARGIPVMLINGRLSEKSCAGYRKARAFFAPAFRAMDLIVAQSEADRARYVALGAEPSRARTLGSAKYDVARADTAGAASARQLLAAGGIGESDLILVCGSTWPGEESAICGAYRRLRETCPSLRLALAPRHAERRNEVEADIRGHGLTCLKRSAIGAEGDSLKVPGGKPADVFLIDSTGELMGFYACASAIFVGKSLCGRGGQNVIEPAMLGKPVIVGPHMENFSAVLADFLAADAIVQVKDAAGLEAALRRLLGDAAFRASLGERARRLVETKRGILRETVRLMRGAIGSVS
ncbi:MAG: 3-deoxy-D-manno-octulosonic acid transferase [Verrucomicrobiota bacterium]|nr:3-deoxy-D-manno-octulosonic acid transferase [Verrucomicrobiota bacterium]